MKQADDRWPKGPVRFLALPAEAVAADPASAAALLEQGLEDGAVIALPAPGEQAALAAALSPQAPPGPAVVLGSGGSAGGRRWVQLGVAGLEAAADGLGPWLLEQGLDPATCQWLDPLPLHHVSGLMPWLRARRLGGRLRWLAPALLRDPVALAAACPLPADQPALLSLVPTQLRRLLEHRAGEGWLRGCRVIWVGGAALPEDLAECCRRLELPLSPCYGSSETGAMVTALAPERFLAGESGCGTALPHAQLRIDPATGAVQVRAASLALGEHAAGRFQPLPLDEGWWSSGDLGRWGKAGGLELLGRCDGAINSGGETVFPEQVELRLLAAAREAGLPLRHLLLLAEPDPLWGERLVALVRAERSAPSGVGACDGVPDGDPLGAPDAALIPPLVTLAAALPSSQRPKRWLACPELAPSPLGKWQRGRWRDWLQQRPEGS
ncbi:AMP-binding protein [Vulcanococcus limneticus]|uniref:AMP-binding protein n=1 Tax=Vulcanococcus limneticus TaxID=2170428 RepID=UPI00398C18E3